MAIEPIFFVKFVLSAADVFICPNGTGYYSESSLSDIFPFDQLWIATISSNQDWARSF
jgi:hypothetical protein